MNYARFTILSDAGTVYSWVESDEHWGENEFESRFGRRLFQIFGPEETEDPSKPIYGVLEALGQSDECPPFLRAEGVVGGSIAWLGDGLDAVDRDTKIHFGNGRLY